MASQTNLFTFTTLRGGRNGVDSPLVIPEHQCADVVNMDFFEGTLGRKRRGAQSIGAIPYLTASILTLARHFATGADNESDLLAIDRTNKCRLWTLVGGGGIGTAYNMALLDADATTRAGKVHWATFNRKLYLAYKSSKDRLHLIDSSVIPPVMRLVGLGPTVVPTVTAGAAGAVSGTRWYRTVRVTQSSGIILRKSEPGPAVSQAITNVTGWNVAQGTNTDEGHTHIEIQYAAAAAGPWYLWTTIAKATLTPTLDTLAPANFPPLNAVLAPSPGSNSAPPSCKYLLVDEARMLFANSWTNQDHQSRVWWSPVIYDVSGTGNNDERIDLSRNSYIDFDPGDGGEITGIGGPMFDSPYVFKVERVYKMVRTGLAGAPYRPVTVSKKCGAINQRTIVLAEDEAGNEALYFLSRRGPYRVGVNGLQYCGRDIEDLWATVNVLWAAGTDTNGGAHGIYHQDLHQVWWYVPTLYDCPDLKLVFDVRLGQFTVENGVRGGWVRHRGPSCRAWCSSMHNISYQSYSLRPHVAQEGVSLASVTASQWAEQEPQRFRDNLPNPLAVGDPVIWRCDMNFANDEGTPFASEFTTRAIALSGSVAIHAGVIEGHLVAGLDPVTVLLVETVHDFGMYSRSSEGIKRINTLVKREVLPIRDLAAVSAAVLQIRVHDTGSPTELQTPPWVIDQLILRVRREEDR